MKKILVAILFAVTLTACSTESNEVITSNKLENVNPVANKSVSNEYDEGDLKDVRILNVKDFPISQEETDAISTATSSRCVTTDHFVGVNTGTHWYHVSCGGSHYIIAYYPDYGWGNPRPETGYDSGIWHGKN